MAPWAFAPTREPGPTSAEFSNTSSSQLIFGGGLPLVIPHTVFAGASFCLGKDLLVTPLEVIHGRLPVMAYRFNDFAYATDLSEIPPATMVGLRDLDVLVLDCFALQRAPDTSLVEKALGYVEELKPRRAYFTHIAHDVKHARDSAKLPDRVEWAHDGLRLLAKLRHRFKEEGS